LEQNRTGTATDHDTQMWKTFFVTVFAARTRPYILLPSQSIWLLCASLEVTDKMISGVNSE